jgi:hypothetical protein
MSHLVRWLLTISLAVLIAALSWWLWNTYGLPRGDNNEGIRNDAALALSGLLAAGTLAAMGFWASRTDPKEKNAANLVKQITDSTAKARPLFSLILQGAKAILADAKIARSRDDYRNLERKINNYLRVETFYDPLRSELDLISDELERLQNAGYNDSKFTEALQAYNNAFEAVKFEFDRLRFDPKYKGWTGYLGPELLDIQDLAKRLSDASDLQAVQDASENVVELKAKLEGDEARARDALTLTHIDTVVTDWGKASNAMSSAFHQ